MKILLKESYLRVDALSYLLVERPLLRIENLKRVAVIRQRGTACCSLPHE